LPQVAVVGVPVPLYITLVSGTDYEFSVESASFATQSGPILVGVSFDPVLDSSCRDLRTWNSVCSFTCLEAAQHGLCDWPYIVLKRMTEYQPSLDLFTCSPQVPPFVSSEETFLMSTACPLACDDRCSENSDTSPIGGAAEMALIFDVFGNASLIVNITNGIDYHVAEHYIIVQDPVESVFVSSASSLGTNSTSAVSCTANAGTTIEFELSWFREAPLGEIGSSSSVSSSSSVGSAYLDELEASGELRYIRMNSSTSTNAQLDITINRSGQYLLVCRAKNLVSRQLDSTFIQVLDPVSNLVVNIPDLIDISSQILISWSAEGSAVKLRLNIFDLSEQVIQSYATQVTSFPVQLSAPGRYRFEFNVANEISSTTCSRMVNALERIESVVMTTNNSFIAVDATLEAVVLLTSGSNVTTQVSWGDGTPTSVLEGPSGGSTPVSHQFSLKGVYEVVANASNMLGFSISSALTVVVEEAITSVTTNISGVNVPIGLIRLGASAVPISAYTYEWTLTFDQTTSAVFTTVMPYLDLSLDSPGNYSLSLTASNNVSSAMVQAAFRVLEPIVDLLISSPEAPSNFTELLVATSVQVLIQLEV
jgi:hypothetical protein